MFMEKSGFLKDLKKSVLVHSKAVKTLQVLLLSLREYQPFLMTHSTELGSVERLVFTTELSQSVQEHLQIQDLKVNSDCQKILRSSVILLSTTAIFLAISYFQRIFILSEIRLSHITGVLWEPLKSRKT